jgi:hypothetical protein
MNENQELHYHNCDMYVRFNLNTELNGQHIIECPNCGHKHYRYILDGKISDRRWGRDPSQDQIFTACNTTYSTVSFFESCTSATTYLRSLWFDTITI